MGSVNPYTCLFDRTIIMLSEREKQIIDLAVKTAIDKISTNLLLLQKLIDNLKGKK